MTNLLLPALQSLAFVRACIVATNASMLKPCMPAAAVPLARLRCYSAEQYQALTPLNAHHPGFPGFFACLLCECSYAASTAHHTQHAQQLMHVRASYSCPALQCAAFFSSMA